MRQTIFAVLVILLGGCGADANRASVKNDSDVTTSQLGMSWEDFQKVVVKVPGTKEGVLFDGDTFVSSTEELRRLYEAHIRTGNLIVNRLGNLDDRWTDAQKVHLTYCVSNSFEDNKDAVIEAMYAATDSWEFAANVRYVYESSEDANCNRDNGNVVFDVNPVDWNNNGYAARAFFPGDGRENRTLEIDDVSLRPGQDLVGILRHELGHTLGFRHEHIRPEAGPCLNEPANWRALTTYDTDSIMHYQCNGRFRSDVSALDASGAASIYGSPNDRAANLYLSFDTDVYLALNPDIVANLGRDPGVAREHWLNFGIKEGRMASIVFSPSHYLASNAGLVQAFGPGNFLAAREHYLAFNGGEGLETSPVFNVRHYLALYPDLQAAFGTNYAAAARHFLDFGIDEGRSASPYFSAANYLNRYADLRQAFGPTNYRAAIIHYLGYGIPEGRDGR
jgi:hypothetical protein